MRYTIPAGTRCKIAPDDDLTAYIPHRSKRETVGEWRMDLDADWMVLVVDGFCVQVRRPFVTACTTENLSQPIEIVSQNSETEVETRNPFE